MRVPKLSLYVPQDGFILGYIILENISRFPSVITKG